MTHNKALTRFCQVKHIAKSLLNFCDQTLHFNFVLALVPGIENLAVYYLSRLKFQPQDRKDLKITSSILVCHVDIDIASKTPKQETGY